jgi:hypothetical protein
VEGSVSGLFEGAMTGQSVYTQAGLISGMDKRSLSLPQPALGPTQPPIRWVPVTLSPEAKRPWRESDNSLTASAEVRSSGAIPPLRRTFSGRGVELIKHRIKVKLLSTTP